MYNLFDFDGTIYDGDSSLDFYLFCLKKKFSVIKFLPIFIWYVLFYKLKKRSKEEVKEKFFSFVCLFSNIDDLVLEFWNKKEKKIKKFYLDREHTNDIIVTASPKFLIKPIGDKLGVHDVIASDVNEKNGKFNGGNCYGEEKVRLLKKKYKKIKVLEAYSDNISDKSMIELAKDRYYVSNNKIEEWNEEKILKKDKNFSRIICFFFIYYLVCGIFLSYHYDFKNTYDLLFDADTARIIGDFSNIFANHYRLQVHPLLVLFVQPIILFLTGITQDNIISILIFSSLITSFSVGVMYKIIYLFREDKKISLIISLIFGFCFSNLVFTAGIELYNIAALTLICLFYLICSIIKDKCNKNYMFYLFVVGILLFSITVTNYVVFLIGCFILFISKKINIFKLLALNGFVVLTVFILSFVQNYLWHNTPLVNDFVDTTIGETSGEWTNFNIGVSEIKKVILDDYFYAIVGNDLELENVGYPRVAFINNSYVNILVVLLLYILMLFCLFKNFKKNKYINLFLILVLLFNTCLHIVYGNECAFLYSQHFLYLYFLILGVNCFNNKKIKIFLVIFLIYEFFMNQIYFKKLLDLVGSVLKSNYFMNKFSLGMIFLILFVLFVIIGVLIYLIKKDILKLISDGEDDRGKLLILLIFKCILVVSMFVTVQTTSFYQKFLNLDIKEYLSQKKDLSDYYVSEFDSFYEYKKEYIDFVNDYNIEVNNDFKDIDFYLFGFGNRDKYVFKDNRLISIDDNKTIYKWNIDEYQIIPNLYMVVFKLKNGDFGKIYENEDGIFIEIDKKVEIIDNTNVKLFNFNDYKYSNVMKVLYGELLFNIKDNMFIPNVIVYDKVWYRDAAMGAMVLEKTDSLELIEKGISEIKDIYDKQNAGVKEADNLGEVLYLLSLIDNPNQDLIQDIINEAEKLSDNGYIKGTTDFSSLYYYQNAWYHFGVDRLGLNTDLVMPIDTDSYTASAWWYKKYNTSTLIGGGNINYPYLAWAEYHSVGSGELYCGSLYPLSYEAYASQANYIKLKVIDKELVSKNNSPTHVWVAAEMLLVLLDN